MATNPINRRAFLSSSVASLIAISTSKIRVLGANNRLRIGLIGCGGLATGAHMPALMKMKESDNCEIVAACDVYQPRLDNMVKETGAKPFKDYRAMLEQKDIDYVTIVTPEHWHAQMTLDALDAGKHVYCEKPMTWSTDQAKKVVAKVKSTNLKLQVGVQGMSDDSYETAQRYIKEGALGKVVAAQIDYSRNYKHDFWSGEYDPNCKPGVNLDWEAFLGPAPKRPFEPDRFFYWRRYWDYSGGIATDLFVHRITRLIRALDLKFPDKVVGTGGKNFWVDSKAEIPDTFNMMCDYPGGINVTVMSSMANDTPIPHVIRGHEGTLEFTRTGFVIREQRYKVNDAPPRADIVHVKTGAEDITLHQRNLMNAIRNNEALKCDVMMGYYGVVAVRLAVDSYRKRKYMAWDAQREKGVAAKA
jgi:predicted dehydrogenase